MVPTSIPPSLPTAQTLTPFSLPTDPVSLQLWHHTFIEGSLCELPTSAANTPAVADSARWFAVGLRSQPDAQRLEETESVASAASG